MIQLNPIHPAIQKTLQEKIKISGKEENSSKQSILDSKRSVWAKMISLSVPSKSLINPNKSLKSLEMVYDTVQQGENRPIVISGGQETTELLPEVDGLQPISGKLKTKFNEVHKGKYNRPIAGLTGITTNIQGDYKAVRTIDISWTCWDFDTLTALTPFFLHPGSSVAVEFGWMWPGHKPSNFVYNNWGNINASFITNQAKRNIIDGKGHQEFLYGLISNFNWTGRDDGGFDCTTKLVSVANNIFGQPLGNDNEIASAFELSEEMREQIAFERTFWNSQGGTNPGTVGDEVLNLSPVTDSVQRSVMNKLSPKITKQRTDLAKGSIEDIPPKLLFKNLSTTLINMKYNFEFDYASLGLSFQNKRTEKKDSPFDNTILVGEENPVLNSIGDIINPNFERTDPYVSYGWFEDNLLNRVVAQIAEVDGAPQIVRKIRSVEPIFEDGIPTGEFESVKIRNDVKNLKTLNGDEVIIPGQFDFDREFLTDDQETSTKFENRKRSGKGKAMSNLARQVRALPTFAIYNQEEVEQEFVDIPGRAQSGERPKPTVTNQGYLRNLLINVKIIEDSFSSANTVEDGLNTLLSKISNACGGFWDFKVTVDENGLYGKVVEAGTTVTPVRELLKNKSMNVVTGEVPETYTNDGLMVFPTWRTNSIVYASELTSRIPSEMTAAIAYGNNLSSLERGAEDSAADRRGKAIGKLLSVETEDKLLKDTERVFGNTKFNAFGYNELPDKKGRVKELTMDGGANLNSEHIIQRYTDSEIYDILKSEISWDFGNVFGAKKNPKKWEADYRYLYNDSGKMKKHYQSASMYFLKGFPSSLGKTEDVLVPIDLTITIDGTGGIYAGECFTSTHLSDKYLESTVYQIMNVSHQLTMDGWKTTLTGKMRIDHAQGAVADPAEEIIKIYENVEKGALDPPFLSFDNYLDSVKGKKSPYKFDTEEQIKARKQRKQDAADAAADAEARKRTKSDNEIILEAVLSGDQTMRRR